MSAVYICPVFVILNFEDLRNVKNIECDVRAVFSIMAVLLAGCLQKNVCSEGSVSNIESAPLESDKLCISGVYPHLAMWNEEGECGTGAVVPWEGKLWAVTYGPHCVFESSDKLYEITPELDIQIRKESLGGTHANRMIHKESNQLFIGCYAIDGMGVVRPISRSAMPGRLTGNARSISDPSGKIYFATMEEGLYEVDVESLKVKELIRDGNLKEHAKKFDASGAEIVQAKKSNLHGYHGKGFYSGFGKAFYANNGVHHPLIEKDPTLKSGALAEWTPGDADWTPIRICQFTEITGPGGIYGSPDPMKTPIWALGWDPKSVILMLNDGGKWSSFRLPKASHSYDGSHGWNTEWPRIRDIGGKDFLMTMHGAFWRFPPAFSASDTSGIRMRSSYLKVIGDFCKWRGALVFGCDDSAQKEFLNKRDLKGKDLSPLNSNSNFWFLKEPDIDRLGPAAGRGSVFLREDVKGGAISDPMLVGGFKSALLVLDHKTDNALKVDILKSDGKNKFEKFEMVEIPANSSKFVLLPGAEWIKVRPLSDAKSFTAHFNLSNPDLRTEKMPGIFNGIMRAGEMENGSAALLRSLDINTAKLGAFAWENNGKNISGLGVYSLNSKMELARDDKIDANKIKASSYEPKGIAYDADSVLIIEEGKRYRLPRNTLYDGKSIFGTPRLAREVATERDLLNCAGTFYELPAVNAQGFAKIRPIATHNLKIFDFCSYRGLMIFSGISDSAKNIGNPHIIVSEDGKFALWAGVIDDLWKLGKPVGTGSPWYKASVPKGGVSDPYLLTGYDKKMLRVVSDTDTELDVEVDIDGTGLWVKYERISIRGGKLFTKKFGDDLRGYWIRFRTSSAVGEITSTLIYE